MMKSRTRNDFDNTLFLTSLILLGIGIVMVYSSSSVLATRYHENSSFFLIKQGISAFLGFVLMILTMRIDYRLYKNPKFIYPVLSLTGLLLILVFIPYFSVEINGARRWLNLGFFSLQPSELAKITVIIYLAYFLDKKNQKDRVGENLYLGPALILGFLLFLIIKEPDFSSSVIILGVALSIYFIAGLKIIHLLSIFICFVPVIYYLIWNCDYRKVRVLDYFKSLINPLDASYHVEHSILALGNGGLFGLGFGNSAQKYLFLPLPHSDFIFSIIGEELGFLGSILIISTFGLLLWRGFLISKKARDLFGSLLAAGITILLGIEIFMNIGVTSALLPVTGIVLPFISCGGTSLLTTMILVGLLLNISMRERRI